MGFVRTAKEIERIEALLAAPRFLNGERLTVEFLTDPEAVEALLPPPLEPAAEPLAIAGVGRWQGDGLGDYAGGSLYLAARHEGVEGAYALAMWMDSEPAVVYGREVFGEPKKLGAARLHRAGDRVAATVERGAETLMELRAELGPDRGPGEAERVAFNFRSRPAPGGAGLDGPAVLTRARMRTSNRSERVGEGSVVLRGTIHDPLDEVPVRSVLRATFAEHDIEATCEVAASVPAEDFLPYHHGRGDDWLSLDTTGWSR